MGLFRKKEADPSRQLNKLADGFEKRAEDLVRRSGLVKHVYLSPSQIGLLVTATAKYLQSKEAGDAAREARDVENQMYAKLWPDDYTELEQEVEENVQLTQVLNRRLNERKQSYPTDVVPSAHTLIMAANALTTIYMECQEEHLNFAVEIQKRAAHIRRKVFGLRND